MSPRPPGDDTAAVAEALRALLAEEFDGRVDLADRPVSIEGGLDSWIHRVEFAGPSLPPAWARPLVVRAKRTGDQLEIARREADIQNWCADVGYPSPRVLRVFDPGELLDVPAQAVEFVDGAVLLDHLTQAPWIAGSVLGDLAGLQARLHRLDPSGFPAVTEDLADRRLSLVRRTVAETGHDALARALERTETLLPDLRDAPDAVCHGDFHPLNVIRGPGGDHVIDWTDAGVGDRHGDVARTITLFRVAWIIAESPVERLALRAAGPWLAKRYQRAYDAQLPIDQRRLARWVPVHLLHGWSQVVGLHAGQFSAGEDDERTDVVPAGLVDVLERWFESAMADLAR